ncbi:MULTISPECIES: flagellin [Aurantimonas]|jgi:flagellin|uniref:flagellin N-terminal helical domain-containing protein n=1 Tax=Aurantimonas TaxID=182269 RepID=UPI00165E17E8|nr:flagellin [Aurantimonas coralicida]MCC4297486.1 flagellin [Aurantimonas coralicida]MCD1641484.1 flagellin [Aurantimonas coralicida]MCW7542425.1 flagellin [Aurantimonas litoralis]MDE0924945.1 flagellin [Aurantimonas coralicida]
MTSINTNTSAMTALQSLSAINSSLDQTQNRISTGYRVGAASDNAAYWSIATTMRSDNKALGAVEDALGLGQAKVDVAYTGMEAAIDVTSEIKSKLLAALEPGVDKTKINSELTELKNQLSSIASSASFSGENWLQNSTAAAAGTKNVVASFNRDSGGNVSVGTIGLDVSSMTLIGTDNETLGLLTKDYDADQLLATPTATPDNYRLIDVVGQTTAATGTVIALASTTTDAQVNAMVRVVDKILSDMTTAASNLGASKSRMDIQSEFVSNLRNSIDKGVGTLVDADMTEESTRLKALQTQQQLGVQALSIANSSSQSVLSLFR